MENEEWRMKREAGGGRSRADSGRLGTGEDGVFDILAAERVFEGAHDVFTGFAGVAHDELIGFEPKVGAPSGSGNGPMVQFGAILLAALIAEPGFEVR